MVRYLGIDCGKHSTKVSEFNEVSKNTRIWEFRTKIGKGDFRDEFIEKRTMVAELEGQVWKVGEGATGIGAELNTSKNDDIHKLCTMLAAAVFCSAKEEDHVKVGVGLPAQIWADVPSREDYRAAILPLGKHTVKYKCPDSEEIKEKSFVVDKVLVFPESIGALFMDDSPLIRANTLCAVLDLGNLNLNAVMFRGTDYVGEESITQELGGTILIKTLASTLSAELGIRCNERNVAEALFSYEPDENGQYYLHAEGVEDPERKAAIEEQSKEIIARVMREHAREVKAQCDGRRWSLELTKMVVIGGTGKLLEKELCECMGKITVLANSKFVNSLGYLRALCQKELGYEIVLPSPQQKNESVNDIENAA